MPLDNERLLRSTQSMVSQRKTIRLYLTFLAGMLLVLLGVSLFSEKYQALHALPFPSHKSIRVSLSWPVKPVILSPLVPVSKTITLPKNRSVFAKVLTRFGLLSSEYILAQIGAFALPKSFYSSAEELRDIFSSLLEHAKTKNSLYLEAKKERMGFPYREKLSELL